MSQKPRKARQSSSASVETRRVRGTIKECFVIMPIGSNDAYSIYRSRYEHIIRPAVEQLFINGHQVFRCIRADFVTKAGSITKDLLGRLYRSEVVIADLTDLNPNVFYELGVRHALRSGTILIALKGTKLPFDVGDLRVIYYEDRLGGETEAIPKIQEMLKSLLSDVWQQDSPVLHNIPELAELGAVKEYQVRIAALERERDVYLAQLAILEKTSLANQATLEAMRQAIEQLSGQLPESQRKNTQVELRTKAKEADIRLAAEHRPVTNIPVDRTRVFTLMPFNARTSPIFEAIKEAAQEVGLQVFRADEISVPGPIIEQVYQAIAESPIIVAVLTDLNHNVMYELGVAQAMGKQIILLAETGQSVPFDLAHRRVVFYDGGSGIGLAKLRQQLARALAASKES